ncbi:MAG TPA: hypothetical protein PLB00_12235 [Pseudomonadota bacterium]|nr:hypothetical protein [Pseudomonadota bacterium]
MARRTARVFINCPFDSEYWPLFEVLVFTVIGCGLRPSSALQESDSATSRIDKIVRLIRDADFGIHDLSRVGLDSKTSLPRFNMPFELGLDLGCRRFGSPKQRRKKILILDSKRFRFQAFISDIAGQDISIHENDTSKLFKVVRDFLAANLSKRRVPGQARLESEFRTFARELPGFCEQAGLDRTELAFPDFVRFATKFVHQARTLGRL